MAALPEAAPGRQSALYVGRVRHRRTDHVPHAFERALYMFYLDLAELPEVLGGSLLWSDSRPAPVRFRRQDYFGDPALPLDAAVRNFVEAETGLRPTGRIGLLTQLRHFGYGFNPISVYYVWDAAGTRVENVVAEVSNTPWRERHCYLVPCADPEHPGVRGFESEKVFHVSPFMEMNHSYRWRLSEPRERLMVHLENWQEGAHVFDATLWMDRRDFTPRALRWLMLRYPWISAQVVAGIYYEAARLWWKGATFQPHPRWTSGTPASTPAEDAG
jgi:uncharacterized protein